MQAGMSPQRPGVLSRIWPISKGFGERFNINIVVVPEVGSPVQNFRESPWTWLGNIPPSLSIRPQVFAFEYTLDNDKEPVWQSLIRRGGELLHSILDNQKTFGIFERPMIFICHGLGGTILKSALSIPYGQYYNPVFRQFLNVHSGIVFLGTPHPTYTHQFHWPKLNLVLRSTTKLLKKTLVQAELEAAIVANESLKFEEAGIEVPVLSGFETKTTRIPDGIFTSHKSVLVTEQLAETSLKYEKIFAMDRSHKDICDVDVRSPIFQEFLAMIQTVVSRPARENISLSSNNSVPPDDSMWASTVADINPQKQPIKVVQEPKPRSWSKDATFSTAETAGFEIIPAMYDFAQSRPAPKVPYHLLEPETRNWNFVGRETVLSQMENTLQRSPANLQKSTFRNYGPKSFALCGFGGVGKSQIAIEYVHRHKAWYDVVLWIQADNDNSIADRFGQIATGLRLLNDTEKIDSVVSRNVVIEWLSNPIKQSPTNVDYDTSIPSLASWLLVFDNADDLDVLRDYLPSAGVGAIIVTSRDPFAKNYLNIDAGTDLEPLSSQEASTLMMALAGCESTHENREQSFELAMRLGGLPIAITQIAAMIHRRDLTFKEFVEIFDEESSKKELLLGQDQYSHTLSTIWALEELNDSARRLLDVLALLDTDCIQESLLINHPPQRPANEFPSTNLQYIEARTTLMKSSLVKRNRQKDQLLLHRLIQDVTRAHMTTEQLRTAFELVVNILCQNWPEASFDFSHETSLWVQADIVVPHILKISKIYAKTPQWKLSISIQGDLSDLLRKGGWHVAEKGNFKVAETMFLSALKICEAHPEDLPKQLADATFCLSSHAADTNQFGLHLQLARRHFDQRMKIENQKPALELGAGMAHSEMALGYLLNGDYGKAIEHSTISRQINEKTSNFLSGTYWPFFGIIHHAQALQGLNREDEAIDMLLETLRWREARFGPNDTESFKLGYTLQVLGAIRAKQGNRVESLELFTRALVNYEATIGLNHHRTGHVLVKLAEEHAYINHPETANIFFDQALKIFASHSAYNREQARTTFKKAQFHGSIGNEKEATDLFRRAEALYSQIVPDHQISGEPSLRLGDFDAIVAIWAR